jgi:hypothetical protein
VDKTGLADLCPAVLYELSKDECQRQPKQEEEEGGEKEDVGRGVYYSGGQTLIYRHIVWLCCYICVYSTIFYINIVFDLTTLGT